MAIFDRDGAVAVVVVVAAAAAATQCAAAKYCALSNTIFLFTCDIRRLAL